MMPTIRQASAFVTPRDSLRVTPRRPLDPTRSLVDLDLDGARVPDDRRLGDPGPRTVLILSTIAGLFTAGLIVYTLDRLQG